MSSNNRRWATDQGSSAHERIRKKSMQAAKLPEDGGVSSQPLELEDESSSQAKTAKKAMLVVSRSRNDTVPWLLLRGLVLGLVGLAWSMFPLWLQEEVKLHELLLLVLLLLVTPVEPLLSWFLGGLLLVVALLANMFLLEWQKVVVYVLLVVVPVVLLNLDRVLNFWRARKHEWVLDSGAGIHHTSNLDVLLEGGDFRFQDAPLTGDDAPPHVVSWGSGSVRTKCFEFPGVRYVHNDDDARNVVSVSQLARDHGLVTVFEPTTCHIKDKKTGHIVGKGHCRNGMYMLDYLRIVSQCQGDRGASGGSERGDGEGGGRGHGEQGNNDGEEGDSGMAEGGRSRDGRGGGTKAKRNQEQGNSGSGAAGGYINDEETVNELEEEEGSSENEIQEMNDEDDTGKTHQEINGNGKEEEEEEEEDKKRGGGGGGGGGGDFGESSSSNKARNGLLGLSRFVFVLCSCVAVAACILLLQCTRRGTRVICKLATFHNFDFRSLPRFLYLCILNLSIMQPIGRKLVKQIGSLYRGRSRDREDDEEEILGAYVQESSHPLVEHNREKLFGLSRFDVTTDPTGYWRRQLPARAFSSSTTAARQEDFFVDSGASFHTTWKESNLFPYPWYLENHTKPPTLSLGGIAAGSIAVTRTGYLNGNKIMLDGVLLAPEAQANLVSVGQLSIYYGVQVEMDEVGVVIKKRQDGVQIGGGRMLNNLYMLEYFLPGGLFAHGHTPHP